MQSSSSSRSLNSHPNSDSTNGVIRYAQIREDANHEHCSEGNKRALLAERLSRLGDLAKELEESEWKYNVGDHNSDGPQPYGKGVEERHFSLGRRL